ncbi:MAG: N-acetyltransferase [Chloroflexi bacterium]|nr:MAG: N-acetyltransferase [Chloroflexota bacterium]
MTAILADMSSKDALAGAVEANMAEQFAYFGRSPRADIDDSPELLRFISGIPIPEYNGMIRARLSPELAPDAVQSRIQAAIASFAELRQPFFWWVGPTSTPSDLGGYLTAAGLVYLGDGPGMAVDLHALDERQPESPGLSIVPVADERTLRDWVEVAGAGYGEPESVRQARYEVHKGLGLAADLALQRYVAYQGSHSVGMSALFLGAGVAGVYEVATAKDARRQGIGAAVTLAPLCRAHELGYHIGVLQASEMGAGVYTRLGFRQVCTFSLYAWEPPI